MIAKTWSNLTFVLLCTLSTSLAQSSSFIVSSLASVPNLVGFWPLSASYGTSDAKGGILGIYRNPSASTFSIGPLGLDNTSFETNPNSNPRSVVSFTSESLKFLGSFTWAGWISVNRNSTGPLFEYFNGQGFAFRVWQQPGVNQIRVWADHSSTEVLNTMCSIFNTWTFIAVSYDATTRQVVLFCDDDFAGSFVSPGNAVTTNVMFLGYRQTTNNAMAARFACVSAHDAVLNIYELMVTKKVCAAFSSVTCTLKCQNGGTCVALNTCSCTPEWTGSYCQLGSKQKENVEKRIMALKALVGYWPLTIDYGNSDYHRVMTASTQRPMEYTAGPYGVQNTAARSFYGSPMSYIRLESTSIDFEATQSAWTLALWLNAPDALAPIFEWMLRDNTEPGTGMPGQNLYANVGFNTAMLDTLHGNASLQCGFVGTWKFIAVVFDNITNEIKLFCDSKFDQAGASALTMSPATSNTLHIGYNFGMDEVMDNGQFACLSIHSAALTSDELVSLSDVCRHFSVNCSSCANGYCLGHEMCTCKPGWIGPKCDTAICNENCTNGETCSAPDLCTCSQQWTGTICQVPICTPSCKNGGTCLAPDVCACRDGWNGTACDFSDKKATSICDDVNDCVCSKLRPCNVSSVVAVPLSSSSLSSASDILTSIMTTLLYYLLRFIH